MDGIAVVATHNSSRGNPQENLSYPKTALEIAISKHRLTILIDRLTTQKLLLPLPLSLPLLLLAPTR
ncbi:MAG: hypothetical protein ABJL35_14995 [Parasphingorhabdus sp.]|uniref:hypothetical protein n=1 Tax=Parasphingorhabdus sp. TaxID=2709688 RepID=UPI00329860DE